MPSSAIALATPHLDYCRGVCFTLNMSATIDHLSPELIAIVAEYLGCQDLLNFRLSVRYLRDCSLTLFTNRFFRERVHLLSRNSLLALLEISRHSFFGLSMQTVVISPDHVIPDQLRDSPRSLPYWYWGYHSPTTVDGRGCKKHLAEQEYLRITGLDTAYLTQILKNASNCREIFLDDGSRPWGATAIKRETGLYPSSKTESDYSKNYFKRAVHVLIAAMTASEAPIITLAMDNGIERVHVHPSMLVFPVSYLDHVPCMGRYTYHVAAYPGSWLWRCSSRLVKVSCRLHHAFPATKLS